MAQLLYLTANGAAKLAGVADLRTVVRRYHPDATLLKLDKLGRQLKVPLYRIDDSGEMLSARKPKKA